MIYCIYIVFFQQIIFLRKKKITSHIQRTTFFLHRIKKQHKEDDENVDNNWL